MATVVKVSKVVITRLTRIVVRRVMLSSGERIDKSAGKLGMPRITLANLRDVIELVESRLAVQ